MTGTAKTACSLLLLGMTLVLPSVAAGQISERFSNVDDLVGDGWVFADNSTPLGIPGWFQGLTDSEGFFDANSGAPSAYIASTFSSVNTDDSDASTFTLSNWLLTPEVPLVNGSVFGFATRTLPLVAGLPVFPDRLEVRLSVSAASVDVGNTAESVGAFNFGGQPLLVINPTLTDDGYPRDWTPFDVTVTGLAAPTRGRFAFRHYVTDVGNIIGVNNGDYVGVDDVTYLVAPMQVPEPSAFVLLVAGIAGMAGIARRKHNVS